MCTCVHPPLAVCSSRVTFSIGIPQVFTKRLFIFIYTHELIYSLDVYQRWSTSSFLHRTLYSRATEFQNFIFDVIFANKKMRVNVLVFVFFHPIIDLTVAIITSFWINSRVFILPMNPGICWRESTYKYLNLVGFSHHNFSRLLIHYFSTTMCLANVLPILARRDVMASTLYQPGEKSESIFSSM